MTKTKTKIMYKAYLSYGQLKEYLDLLLVNGLIDSDEKEQTFKTSVKGIRFLNIYDQLSALSSKKISGRASRR